MRRLVPGLGGVKLDPVPGFLIRAAQGASAGGGDDLVSVKGKGPVRAEHPALPPPVFGTQRFRGVLQHGNAVFPGNLHDLPHAGGHAVEVHRNDGFGGAARLPDAVPDGFLQHLRRHVPRLFLTVHKHRGSPLVNDGIGGSGKGHGLAEDFIPRPHSQHHQPQMKGGSAGRQGHHMRFPQVFLQFPFKSVHVRPHRRHPL